ncbi:hypothetical protein [Vulcanisaeta sp. JCM 14467]
MTVRKYVGAALTSLGIILMAYALGVGIVSIPHAITSNDALMFVFGTYFIIVGGALWVGEVPKEVLSRVRREALGARGGKS